MPWRASLVLLTVLAVYLLTGATAAHRDGPAVSVTFLPADQVDAPRPPERGASSPMWDWKGAGTRY